MRGNRISRSARAWTVAAAAGLWLAALAKPALAETHVVRIGGIYGLANLPTYVVEDQHLIEEGAAAAGMPDLKVIAVQVSGGATAANLLLSGNADVASVGSTNLIFLWDKTYGMPALAVRGMLALCDSPVSLITTNSRIHSLKDYTAADRIAVTSLKVSVQAITLQMAAAKAFGWDGRDKLDPLMVMMPHQDGMASLLSGSTEVQSQAAQLPFSVEELQSGKAHLILTSDQVLGEPTNLGVVITTARFEEQNPKVYAIVANAFTKAVAWINANKLQAAEIYVRHEPQKNGVQWVYNILNNPDDITFTTTPHGTAQFADFMFKADLLKHEPQSWKDLYWNNAWSLNGN
jgi:NitT/TauT family transport system substrate-binding protein